ncbi:MAG TPA: coproporphyrinogen III oxidase, partial [Pelobium sp.]|nr:coproporphyrinogen III oxidase [Pelobium sp.]
YWRGVHYLGIGPSAHSFNGKSRQWNVANNANYLAALEKNEIPFNLEILTLENRYNEYLMTSLRTQWGVELSKIEADYGAEQKNHLLASADEYLNKNWLMLKEEKLILTQTGKLYADLIASELFITENEFQK